MIVVVVALGAVVALLAVLVVGLLRSHAEILRRLHDLGADVYDDAHDAHDAHDADGAPEPPPGRATRVDVAPGESPPAIHTRPDVPDPRPAATPAADLAGTTPTGAARAVPVRDVPHATLLAFLSSGCGTCLEFWRAFRDGEADQLPGHDTRLVVITKGPEEESPAAVAALAPSSVTTLLSSAAYDDYGVPVSPYFILVDGPTGQVVGEGAAASWPQVRDLLAQAAADAGLAIDGPSRDVTAARRAMALGRHREARADADLAAAGIGPGHASLYPTSVPVADGHDEQEQG